MKSKLLLVFLGVTLLSSFSSFDLNVKGQNQNVEAKTVSSLTGPPIVFSESSNFVCLNNSVFVVEFYKGTAGYNKIYNVYGDVLVYDDRIVLEYFSNNQWKQIGTAKGISYVKVDDYHYEVVRFYTDFLGTTYNVSYTVKSASPIKITMYLKFGKTYTYRIAWYPSGITKTFYSLKENAVTFGYETANYDWIRFDWNDVYQSFGNITGISFENVANGKKANIYFNIGFKSTNETLTVDPSIIGTSSTSYAVSAPFQRKTFYANGRFWVFWSNGVNLICSTSTNGLNWISTNIRSCTDGSYFSVWFDGTYLHYAYADNTNVLRYRRGVPNSDGSITWSTSAEQTKSFPVDDLINFPFVSVDTNGYAWIAYIHYYYATGYTFPCVIKSQYNNGTLGSVTEQTLSTIDNSYWKASIVPLSNGKMLAVYAYDLDTVKVKMWNGSSWQAEVSSSSIIQTANYHSVVAENNGENAHIVFLRRYGSYYDLIHVTYYSQSNSLSEERVILQTLSSTSSPTLALDVESNTLYCFWATKTSGFPPGFAPEHIYCSISKDGGWTWTHNDFVNEETYKLYSADRLTCFYVSYGKKIGVLYLARTTAPFDVKFEFLTTANPPTIGEFQAPNVVYANRFFFLNATINDADGTTDFVNATVELSYNITLKWDNASNSFSVLYDPNNYCVLNVSGSFSMQKNSTALVLCWKIMFRWNYTEGYVSIVSANTKVYDKGGYSGSGYVNNLFYFEDDLIVYSASVNYNRVNPSQLLVFSGTLRYQGSTLPFDDTSGITVKVKLGNVLKGYNSTVQSDGSFIVKFESELGFGLYMYTVFAETDEPTVENKTLNVIVDRDIMENFVYSGGTMFNLTVKVKSEYYVGGLNNTYVSLKVYMDGELFETVNIETNETGFVSTVLSKNVYKNCTLTFNLTDSDGIYSYTYSCPVYVYVENIEVFSMDPLIVYSGDYITIIMKYLPKAQINETYVPLSNVYWKALIYSGEQYYGRYIFQLYNGTFANDWETKTLNFPVALNEGSYFLNMTFYIYGSETFLGNALTQYFVVKPRESVGPGGPGGVGYIYTFPLTVTVRDEKGNFVSDVIVLIFDIYNATVYEGKTDSWGSVVVNLKSGEYNVTIFYDSKFLTETVVISNEPVTKQFTISVYSLTPIMVSLDFYSIFWLVLAVIGAVCAIVVERKGYTTIAIFLGLFTVGAVLHSALVLTHQMKPFFTFPQFNFSELLKLPSFSFPSLDLSFIKVETLTLIVACLSVMAFSVYYVSSRGSSKKHYRKTYMRRVKR